ncbi:MAG: hypothetical protein IKQ61_00710 [Spirochaetales bacterium]|nr:hypothetical protein [Spirochaetales bacterium]
MKLTKRLVLTATFISVIACSQHLVIDDLSSLYISLSDASSDIIRQNIAVGIENNCSRLELLSTKKFNSQIRLFSDKINRETDPLVKREYYRELNVYKRLYYDKNYDTLRLSDIPLAYRRDSDKLDSGSALLTFGDNRYIITETEYELSGLCIASAERVTLYVNGTIVSEHNFTDSEMRTFAKRLTIDRELTPGENVLTVRMSRTGKEYYDFTKKILVIDSAADVAPNEKHFAVKQTDKSEIFHYTMFEIDLSKAAKNLDRYIITHSGDELILANDVSDDKLWLTAVIGEQHIPLFENNSAARNILTVKWYNDGVIIIEYYTGEENYTDYLIMQSGTAVKASELAAAYGLHNPIIMNRINDGYRLIQYGEKNVVSLIYDFDSSFELQSIRKQKIEKYLYKQFGNDEVFYNL